MKVNYGLFLAVCAIQFARHGLAYYCSELRALYMPKFVSIVLTLRSPDPHRSAIRCRKFSRDPRRSFSKGRGKLQGGWSCAALSRRFLMPRYRKLCRSHSFFLALVCRLFPLPLPKPSVPPVTPTSSRNRQGSRSFRKLYAEIIKERDKKEDARFF